MCFVKHSRIWTNHVSCCSCKNLLKRAIVGQNFCEGVSGTFVEHFGTLSDVMGVDFARLMFLVQHGGLNLGHAQYGGLELQSIKAKVNGLNGDGKLSVKPKFISSWDPNRSVNRFAKI